MDFYTLNKNIIEWASDRGILDNGKPSGQIRKLLEEVFEFHEAILEGDVVEETLELGDILVVTLILAEMRNLNPVDALEEAYNKIKHRKGYLNKDGVFVKEA